jgi:rRNA maturation endonuclease Nob1
MEIKKYDTWRCIDCDTEFFIPLDLRVNFCPFCGDEKVEWQYESEMVVD